MLDGPPPGNNVSGVWFLAHYSFIGNGHRSNRALMLLPFDICVVFGKENDPFWWIGTNKAWTIDDEFVNVFPKRLQKTASEQAK